MKAHTLKRGDGMKRLRFWGAALVFIVLLMKPEETVQNAQRAMGVWYSSVAPALFPFLALMPMLTSKEACSAYETMFSKWMRPLFRLPGSAAPAIIVGMIAGSPGGMIALHRVAKNSKLSISEVHRIALALGGLSPAYLIMGVGQGLHGSLSLGIKLAGIQAGIQMLTLFITRNTCSDDELKVVEYTEETGNSITSAVESVMVICGYMVFYSVIAGAISDMLGKNVGCMLLPFMDLPSGLAGLAASDIPLKNVIQGSAIGFSGLCIISQNINALRELNPGWKQYLATKLISGVAFGALSMMTVVSWNNHMGEHPEVFRKTYAVSLLIAGIFIIPGLYLLSKTLFLNIRKNESRVQE